MYILGIKLLTVEEKEIIINKFGRIEAHEDENSRKKYHVGHLVYMATQKCHLCHFSEPLRTDSRATSAMDKSHPRIG